jgi:hypothetical protein
VFQPQDFSRFFGRSAGLAATQGRAHDTFFPFAAQHAEAGRASGLPL